MLMQGHIFRIEQFVFNRANQMIFCIAVPTDYNCALRKGTELLTSVFFLLVSHTALADMFVAFLSFWACPLHSLTFLSNLNLEVVFLCIWEVRSRLFGGRAKKLLPCLKAITDRVEWVWAGHHFSRRWPTYDVYSVYTVCIHVYTVLHCTWERKEARSFAEQAGLQTRLWSHIYIYLRQKQSQPLISKSQSNWSISWNSPRVKSTSYD